MTSFNRSPDDRQRPAGPRPFIGGSAAPTSRVLRPLAAARRNMAAPFATIPNELSIRETPPSEEPSVAVLSTPLAGLEAFTHAPGSTEASPEGPYESPASALTIDDLVPEGRPWFSDSEPGDACYDATVAPVLEPPVIEAPLEIVDLVLNEVVAPAVEDTEANNPSVAGEADLGTEGAEEQDPDVNRGHASSSWMQANAAPGGTVSESPQVGHHADPYGATGSPNWPEASAVPLEAASKIPQWGLSSDLYGAAASSALSGALDEPQAEGAGAIAHPEETEWSGPITDSQQSVSDVPQLALPAHRSETQASSDWSAPVADSPEAFSEVPHLVPSDEFEREEDAAPAAMVSDEGSPWNAGALARAYAAPELTSLAPVPVDNANDLEALVSETVGAERAVEVLEAVARLVRSREIVVSVGAGASAESVLASILASLLSDPS